MDEWESVSWIEEPLKCHDLGHKGCFKKMKKMIYNCSGS
ncbi:unnamed protein product [Arabidopsis lyrata]|nr:unnamed protein product [Arabidopsis lyrata]